MSLSRYSYFVLGEDPAIATLLHSSTRRRMQAWCISLHIPITLWAATSFLVAREVFGATGAVASAAAVAAAALIYCLERIILAAPKSMLMAATRVLIGLLTAVLGASAVDLVLFDKEISAHLHGTRLKAVEKQQEAERALLKAEVEAARTRWNRALEEAQCEGNGTCGSRVRQAGPLYVGLLRHAEVLRQDFVNAAAKLESKEVQFEHRLSTLTHDTVKGDAGILMRLQGLHDYLLGNRLAGAVWGALFLFVTLLEMSVVLAKFAFADTADDVIARTRELIARHQAIGYLEAITSPLAGVQHQLQTIYQR